MKQFEARLSDRYLAEVPASRREEVAPVIFAKAWKAGYCGGSFDVEDTYSRLAAAFMEVRAMGLAD